MSVADVSVPKTALTPKLTTASAVLRDLFIVTWAVPEAAVRALVPAEIVLDRLPGADGQLQAFLQLVFALREDARWSPLPASLGEDYHQATLQVLTRVGEERGTLVLKHFTGSTRVAGTLFPVSRAVDEARFHVYVAGDPARQTFSKLAVKVTTDAVQVHLRAEAEERPETTPIGRWSDTVRFLTQRPNLLHPARLDKEGFTLFRTEHAPLNPRAARLTHQILRPWDDLELGEPLLALYQAELPVTTTPPKRFKP